MRATWFTARALTDLCSTTQIELANGLANRGHQITLINGDATHSNVEHGFNHIPLDTSGIRGLQSKFLGRSMRKWLGQYQSNSMDCAIVDWKIANSIVPQLEHQNVPWVLMDRSPPADSGMFAKFQWPSWKSAWRLVRESKVGRGCVVSEQHQLFVHQHTGCELEKISVLQAGVDLQKFKPGKKNSMLTLVYHGRVDKNRGVLSLPMLLQKARAAGVECKLVVIGEGDAFDGLKQIAKRNKLIEVVSTMPRDQLAERLGKAHIGLLPMPETKVWKIASPLKRSEYLASGLLVFGVDHAGHRMDAGFQQWMKLVKQEEFHAEGCKWLSNLDEDTITLLSALSRNYAEEHLSWEGSIQALEDCMAFFIH
jgi:glycosyltransferase involved in cell wall biosynthesis